MRAAGCQRGTRIGILLVCGSQVGGMQEFFQAYSLAHQDGGCDATGESDTSMCPIPSCVEGSHVNHYGEPSLLRQPNTSTKNQEERKPKRMEKDFHYEVN